MGCSDPPLTGVGAPHQCPLGKLAMLPFLYTDVRSILMVLLAFKGSPVGRRQLLKELEHGYHPAQNRARNL